MESVELTSTAKQPASLAIAHSGPQTAAKTKKKDGFVKRLYRQNLSGFVPIPRPVFAVCFFLSGSVVLLAIGVAVLVTALNVKEVVFRYDNVGRISVGQELSSMTQQQRRDSVPVDGNGWTYNLTLTVPHTLKQPVYVYYMLGNFYQNYRRYINSADFTQMHGTNVSEGSLSVCDPIRWAYQQPENNSRGGTRQQSDLLPNGGLINPCGLWAWSYFNDTFSFYTNSGTPLDVSASGLAWSWQRNRLFGKYNTQNYNGAAFINGTTYNATRGGGAIPGYVNQDERFMVWMRPEAHYSFRKLWGVINQDVQAGEYTITIVNRYNTYGFGGVKEVVLSENSWMGGRNTFLGIFMIVVGVLYFMCAVMFLLGRLFHHRPLGDESYLSWHQMKKRKGFVEAWKDFVKR